jgi:hypothetical protein
MLLSPVPLLMILLRGISSSTLYFCGNQKGGVTTPGDKQATYLDLVRFECSAHAVYFVLSVGACSDFDVPRCSTHTHTLCCRCACVCVCVGGGNGTGEAELHSTGCDCNGDQLCLVRNTAWWHMRQLHILRMPGNERLCGGCLQLRWPTYMPDMAQHHHVR